VTDLADCHVHSQFSYDAPDGSMESSCERAVRLGVPAIAFTEHADYVPRAGRHGRERSVVLRRDVGLAPVSPGLCRTGAPGLPEAVGRPAKRALDRSASRTVLCRLVGAGGTSTASPTSHVRVRSTSTAPSPARSLSSQNRTRPLRTSHPADRLQVVFGGGVRDGDPVLALPPGSTPARRGRAKRSPNEAPRAGRSGGGRLATEACESERVVTRSRFSAALARSRFPSFGASRSYSPEQQVRLSAPSARRELLTAYRPSSRRRARNPDPPPYH
jgi:hypothetical protein